MKARHLIFAAALALWTVPHAGAAEAKLADFPLAERIKAKVAAGQPIDPGTQTPAPWREYVVRRTGLTAPEQMTEGAPAQFEPFESGYDPGHPVDRAIMATRNAVFPLHGLMTL